jgi:hypothetical protein
MPTTSLIRRPTAPVGAETEPDDVRYKCKYIVKSQSSNRNYKISFDAAPNAGWWVCSCPGACVHGTCKHLKAAGLQGRKYGKDLATLRALGL